MTHAVPSLLNLPYVPILFLSFNFGTQEALDHLATFPSSREMISQLGIEPPATPFGLRTSPLSFGSLGLSRTNFNLPYVLILMLFLFYTLLNTSA